MRVKAQIEVVIDDEQSSAVAFVGHPIVLEEIMNAVKIHTQKNHDYSGGDDPNGDPLSNFRGSKDFGVAPITGLALRMGDKFKRIQTYIKTGKLKVENEGVKDAFRDLAVYSLLALALLSEEGE